MATLHVAAGGIEVLSPSVERHRPSPHQRSDTRTRLEMQKTVIEQTVEPFSLR